MSQHRRTGRRRLAALATAALAAAGGATLYVSSPAFAETAAQVAARTAPAVAGTPCTSAAAACVDVNKKQAWLIKDGKVMRGPVPIATGGPGKETPTGNVFRVYRKDKAHTTDEFKLPNGKPAPMPDSVFFEDGGIAFHSGDPKRASAGCVHLNAADATAFYNYLQIGNHVQVMDGPVAAPAPAATGDDNAQDSGGDADHEDQSDSDDQSDGGDDSDSDSDSHSDQSDGDN
jgi:lipoprotein-anchoring transpeptidase ErfK/SrfK